MKNVLKPFTLLLAVCAMSFSFVACDSEIGKDTNYEDIKSEHVSEEEWRAALASENFVNFSMKRKMMTNEILPNEEVELGGYLHFDGSNAYFSGSQIRDEWIDGYEFYETEAFEFPVNGEYRHYERDKASDEWNDYDMSASTLCTYEYAFGVYAERFSDFVFDAEKGAYVAENFSAKDDDERYEWAMKLNSSWFPYVELKFADGKLVGWAYRTEIEAYEDDPIRYTNIISVLYDYGKTELPPTPQFEN